MPRSSASSEALREAELPSRACPSRAGARGEGGEKRHKTANHGGWKTVVVLHCSLSSFLCLVVFFVASLLPRTTSTPAHRAGVETASWQASQRSRPKGV